MATEVVWRQRRTLAGGTFELGLDIELPSGLGANVRITPADRGRGLELMTTVTVSVAMDVGGDLALLAQERLPLRAGPVDRIGTQISPGESLRVPDRDDPTRLLRYMIPLSLLPLETREAISGVREVMRSTVDEAYRFLLWRYLPDGTNRELKAGDLELSLDGGQSWTPLDVSAYDFSVTALNEPTISLRAEDIEDLRQRWVDVPQAYDLLWEARRTDTRNGRLVLLVAALEVGVKNFLARRMPDTEWLLENVPSPPVHKMLTEQLRALPSPHGGNCEPPPHSVRRVLRDGIEARNALVHTGMPVEQGQLTALSQAVHDTIRLLDYYAGEAWAIEHVSAATKTEMAAEAQAGDAR